MEEVGVWDITVEVFRFYLQFYFQVLSAMNTVFIIHIPYYLDIKPTSTISPPPFLGSKSYIGLFNRSM